MQAQVPELAQVSFHLQVRRADLVVISMSQLGILMSNMDTMQKAIIDKGYLVEIQMIIDGGMTSINA